MKTYLQKLDHRIERCEALVEKLGVEYQGNEGSYTFHAGWWLGYHQGKLLEMKELRDDIKEEILSVEET